MVEFNYDEAFKRNIGLTTPQEQHKIKKFRVAIPGMGGVGGAHLVTLTRMGFQNFNIADLDEFEVKNLNIQYGASMKTIGKHKAKAMMQIVKDINPQADINCFENAVNKENLDEFLHGVDILIDGLDVFEQDIRRLVYNRALEKKIPVITAAPMGMGTTYLVFMPGGMNYDQFFDVKEDTPKFEKLLKFLMGVSPKLLHLRYIFSEYVSLEKGEVPSLTVGVNLAAGVAGTEAMKILLGRGKLMPVPWVYQFDAYSYRFKKIKLTFGNAGLIQRGKIALAKRRYADFIN
ncbi:MAG: ThiF family adenylyltransferase [Nanoarchaeota archaeon]|nr:ThiF family adenylyltransferase [Nanoarchaeota archaeon]